jgi:DNA-directed RNA polymerase subunit M
MVKFCPECDNLLRKRIQSSEVYYGCICGYLESFKEDIREKEKIVQSRLKLEQEKEIFSPKHEEIYPLTKAECKKCGNKEAEYWQSQIRSADEASTTFYRCTNCSFTWREY